MIQALQFWEDTADVCPRLGGSVCCTKSKHATIAVLISQLGLAYVVQVSVEFRKSPSLCEKVWFGPEI